MIKYQAVHPFLFLFFVLTCVAQTLILKDFE